MEKVQRIVKISKEINELLDNISKYTARPADSIVESAIAYYSGGYDWRAPE
jgi:predicted DNA-binding protein